MVKSNRICKLSPGALKGGSRTWTLGNRLCGGLESIPVPVTLPGRGGRIPRPIWIPRGEVSPVPADVVAELLINPLAGVGHYLNVIASDPALPRSPWGGGCVLLEVVG